MLTSEIRGSVQAVVDDSNEKETKGGVEVPASVARMARIGVRSRSLQRSVLARIPLNHAV
jgi:hypothetical protein